jgi:hypothetical protein
MVNHMIKNHEGVTTMYKKFHNLLTEELKYEPFLAHRAGLHSSRGNYLSSYSVWEMASALKKYTKDEAVKQLRSKKWFSIMLDESEDAGHRNQMALYARSISASGIIENSFLDLIRIKDRTSAGMFESVEKWFKGHEISMRRIYFCGMDTTNTMSGANNGLQRFIRNQNAHCQYIKCHNHRLALIFVHCGKQFPRIKEFTGLMNSFFMMYKQSSLRREVREGVFETANSKPRAPQKAVPTRWLSIEPQNKKLVDSFYLEVDSLIELIARARPGDDCIRIRGIIERLLDPRMMMLMMALRDILPMFNTVQTLMQAHKFIFSDIKALKEKLVSTISAMIANECFEDCACGNKDCKLAQFPERFKWAEQKAKTEKFMDDHISR